MVLIQHVNAYSALGYIPVDLHCPIDGSCNLFANARYSFDSMRINASDSNFLTIFASDTIDTSFSFNAFIYCPVIQIYIHHNVIFMKD